MVPHLPTWALNVIGVSSYADHPTLYSYFSFISQNIHRIEGDIVEIGVFRGSSLLATALLLKALGSDKKVIGFDTFGGFPPVFHYYDNHTQFHTLYSRNIISESHYKAYLLNLSLLSLCNRPLSPEFVSSSGDFSSTSYDLLLNKIHFLELDNVILVKGPFNATVNDENLPHLISFALIDCDLYASYQQVLPPIWSRLSTGGLMYLDEYYSLKFPGARVATDAFCSNLNITPTLLACDHFERWGLIKSQ